MRAIDQDWLRHYPPPLLDALTGMAAQDGIRMFITGGSVRDWLIGSFPRDLDLTVDTDALRCAEHLAGKLRAAFVPLDEKEGVARLVWQGFTIDFASFREGTATIAEDLKRRDFTINALAVPFPANDPGSAATDIIDPTGGIGDLESGTIRMTSDKVFVRDPLRLLRAYRFLSVLGFSLAPATEKLIEDQAGLIKKAAAERTAYELNRIMASGRAHVGMAAMAASGLLWHIIPELRTGVGINQPASHHLDVFNHNLAALDWMEKITKNPAIYFPGQEKGITAYLEYAKRSVWLNWAAIFHDLGKPQMQELRGGRITFYNHDLAGARQAALIGRRLRWSGEDVNRVSRLIELHMWPFHLNNARARTGITIRACLRLIKAAGDDLPGLFMLTMADSLAGQGPGKPPAMEKDLTDLYGQINDVDKKRVKPVLNRPRLITGHDLKRVFGLIPGPLFRKILTSLEEAQVAGEVGSRPEALAWIKERLAEWK